MFAICVNRANSSGDDLVQALSSHISAESVLLCDSATSYNKLADLLGCKKIELIGHESYDKVYHLNTVNNLHSRIMNMFGRFRGVTSKYLNRYLALYTVIASYTVITSYTKASVDESADDMRRYLSTLRANITYISSQTTGLLMI